MEKADRSREIDIFSVAQLLWRYKIFIVSFVTLVCVIAAVVLVRMDNIFEARIVMKPSTAAGTEVSKNISGIASLAGIKIGNTASFSAYNSISAILSDNKFIADFVKRYKYESKVLDDFEELKVTPDYIENTDFMLSRAVKGNIVFVEDEKTGLMTFAYLNKDKKFAYKFVKQLLKEINDRQRKLELGSIQEQIDNYKLEINRTDDIALKNNLAEVISNLIQNKVLSQAQEYYGFTVVVEPYEPTMMEKVRPKRKVMLIAVFVVSCAVSVLGAASFDYMRNSIRNRDRTA